MTTDWVMLYSTCHSEFLVSCVKVKLGFKSDKALINLILMVKVFYAFFAHFVYGSMTSLGDTPRYLNASFTFDSSVFTSSTKMMDFTGSIVGVLPAPIGYIPGALLSTFGIVYFFKVLSISGFIDTYWGRVKFFCLISLPSIGVWTSIHSKEAVGFFFSSICAAFLFKLYSGFIKYKKKDWFLLLLSVYLMVIFKPQYCIAYFSLVSYLLFRNKLSSVTLACMLTVVVVCQISILNYIQPIVDYFALQMYSHFDSESALSTRDNIFISEGDFYKNIIPGVFIAFWGVTFSEATYSVAKSFSFIESLILCSMLLTCVLKIYIDIHARLKLNIFHISILLLFVFWLLFVHYPFGIFNPGSAIRYRNNFIPFLMAAMYLIEGVKVNVIHRLTLKGVSSV